MKNLAITVFFIALSLNGMAQIGSIVIPDGHALKISAILEDHQKKFLYTAEADKTIMWDIKTGKQLYSFSYPGSDSQPVYLDINNLGDKLLVYATGRVYLFDTKTAKQISKSNVYPDEYDVKFSDNGQQIYVGYQGIVVLDAVTMKEQRKISSNLQQKNKLQKLPKNQLLLYNKTGFEVYDMNTYSRISSYTFPAGKNYTDYVYHPFSQKLILWSNQDPIDFYDIRTGNLARTINYKTYGLIVIPSQNSDEMLVTGDAVNSNGYLALDIYDTKTFLKKSSLTNTAFKAHFNVDNGIFDGLGKKAWFIAYNVPYEYDLNAKKIARNLQGKVSSLGMDVFNSIEYDYGTSTLHLSTDDAQFKTIDLLRMVSLVHTDLKETPEAVAASPTGDTLAVFKTSTLLLVNAKTGKTIKTLPLPDKLETLQRSLFFFSSDGKTLHYPIETKDGLALVKMNVGTAARTSINLYELSSLSKSCTDPQRKYIGGFGRDDGSSYNGYVWNIKTGEKVFKQKEVSNDIEKCLIRISGDGSKVLLSGQEGSNVYTLNGNTVSSGKSVRIQKFGSAGANNELTQIVTGGQYGSLEQFTANGTSLRTLGGHSNTVRKVEFSSNDKFIYTIGLDNVIKIWDAASGKIIGTLYLFKNSNDYVFMSEDGRFDGTKDGMQNLYYLKNREPISIDKVFEKYYTPSLFLRLAQGEKFEPIPEFEFKPKPRSRIIYAEQKRNLEVDDDVQVYSNTSGVAEITVNAIAPEDKVDEIRLFHNGKAVNLATRGLFVTDNDGSDSKKYTINLLPGVNNFRAIALNSQRTESEPDEIVVNFKKDGIAPAPPKPNNDQRGTINQIDRNATLHIVVVGINAYKNKINPLTYALPDATAFKAELEKDAKSIVNNVKSYLITDDAASKAGIVAAFDNIRRSAKPEDVFVFYYAGHGYIHPSNKEFYLVSADVADGGESLLMNGISSKELQSFAVDIPAQKQLFIMDACQSAGAFEQMLKHDGEQQKALAVVSRSTGTHWMAASGSTETAKEFSELGHGVFTYSLLEALKGKAANNKMITVNGLKNYLQEIVPQLVKKYGSSGQYPASYGFGNDFPVEIINR